MEQTATGAERSDPGDSEQDEEEDVYEVERIIDMRVEEGEVLYRVRWKNYTSDDDTWEPEAHLEDCREVLLAYRKKVAESKPKKDLAVLPMKSDLFDADSESEDEKRDASPPKKKKKKKKSKEAIVDLSPEAHRKEKKKEKKKWKQERALPAPESDGTVSEEEESAPAAPAPPLPPAPPRSQKRAIESEDKEEAPVTPKKHKKDKPKDGGKQKKDKGKDGGKLRKDSGEGKKRKDHRKELDSTEDEEEEEEEEEEGSTNAEGELCEAPWESPKMPTDMADTESWEPPEGTPATPANPAEKQGEEAESAKAKQKKNRVGLKLQGIRELIQEKKGKKSPPPQKETAQQKLKSLMSSKSASKSHSKVPRSGAEDEPALLSSDSSEAAAVGSVKRKNKSKAKEAAAQRASSSPSSSTGATAKEDDANAKVKDPSSSSSSSWPGKQEDAMEKDQPVSTNLFEKFLLNCEAKDRVPRRQSVHAPPMESRAEQAKTTTPKTPGKTEKKGKTSKESPVQKLEQDRTEKAKRETKSSEAPRPVQSPSAQETEERQERRVSTDSLTDRRGKTDMERGRADELTESRAAGDPLERKAEAKEKREESRERREEPQEKKDESRERREEPREKKDEPREKKDEPRERRERPEETRGGRWEKKAPGVASPEPADDAAAAAGRWKERRRRRDGSEPHLYVGCDDNQEPQDLLGNADRTLDRGQASLNLGVDLKLDWMTLEDFQKHLNGEDEILSAATITPSELRDAVKTGDYIAVKLALNSKEDYNLDQEDSSGMSLAMLAAAGGQDDILRLLIKKGVKVNGRQKNGTTALMHAAEKNFLTTVAILLEAGACVNAQTLGGETALMKACKRGNADVVRLLLEYGADCNILSKHQNNALHFAKLSNNVTVYDYVKDHMNTLSSVAEETIRAYFETRLALLEPVFPLACHRLCEGPDFSLEFNYKPPPHSPAEGSGILLFIFHANFLSEITARLCGPCSVHAVVLNDKFQLPIFLDSHFIYSFSPVQGLNKLFIRLAESPTAKVKLLICAYRVQLQ
ncbi:M-phase phosphoprotein 8-like isoform X2 [Megalops cyprinoides]|uniref:M-phase phosphoprotein 8-like isoform X2 n=1 Tax=Megalops cyprinoides TaxID=118141 RepID=UPI001863FF07|nr:M-phase phosphoprotein 8-like isoform X2 [Megalops cyprinoides]